MATLDVVYQMRMYRKPLSKIQDYCWVVVSSSLSHCARVGIQLPVWLAGRTICTSAAVQNTIEHTFQIGPECILDAPVLAVANCVRLVIPAVL